MTLTARPLVFATRNRGKLVELRELLAGLDVLSIDEAAARLGREIPDVVEDADTFAGNASKKAREVSRATGLPALADDSGLEVDALGGAPGVFSARYAGDAHDDAANNAKLLAALAGVPPPARTARFRSALALADVTGPLGTRVLSAAGTCEGTILDAPRGTGGFGYDPLFFSPELGMTFAEAGVGPKNFLSHRARAMRAIRAELVSYLQSVKVEVTEAVIPFGAHTMTIRTRPCRNGHQIAVRIGNGLVRFKGTNQHGWLHLDIECDSADIPILLAADIPSIDPDQVAVRKWTIDAFADDDWSSTPLSFEIAISVCLPRIISSARSRSSSPSPETRQLHEQIRTAIRKVFTEYATRATTLVRIALANGAHQEAIDGAKEAIGMPGLYERLPADVLAVLASLPTNNADAFVIAVARIEDLIGAGQYKQAELELSRLDCPTAGELAPLGYHVVALGAKVFTGLGMPHVARARLQQLAAYPGLPVRERGFVLETLARYCAPGSDENLLLLENAVTAHLEAGDRLAIGIYVNAAYALLATDPQRSIEYMTRAIDRFDPENPLETATKAWYLHERSRLYWIRRDGERALEDMLSAVRLYESLVGVENDCMEALQIAKRLATKLHKHDIVSDVVKKLDERPQSERGDLLADSIAAVDLADADTVAELDAALDVANNIRLTARWAIRLGLEGGDSNFVDVMERLDRVRVELEAPPLFPGHAVLLAAVHSGIGRALERHGDTDHAIGEYQRSLALHPGDRVAAANLRALLIGQQRWTDVIALLESQSKLLGDRADVLLDLGNALVEVGEVARGVKQLHRAERLAEDAELAERIRSALGRAIDLLSDQSFNRPQTIRPTGVSGREHLERVIAEFVEYVKEKVRMTFWTRDADKVRRFVPDPEDHARTLLRTFLCGACGRDIEILEEANVGAGRYDLLIELAKRDRFVIELKMCGESYSRASAERGLVQLQHYMENARCHISYLIVFDARRNHFGTGIPDEIRPNNNTIFTRFVDIRPHVVDRDAHRS